MSRRAFADLDTAERMAFRDQLDALGGACMGYGGVYAQVAVPFLDSTAAGVRAVDALARSVGLVRDDDGEFFPLGTDQPAEELRHPMPWKYGPARSFWFFLNYRPAPRCPDCGGVLEKITAEQGGAVEETVWTKGGLRRKARPATFYACSGCEFCSELADLDRAC
jgi:hypothetical protein